MNALPSLGSLRAGALGSLNEREPSKKTQSPGEAASDFEALLIAQMLRSARSDSEGWLGTGSDSTSAPLIEMAEDQISKLMAQSGGLGLRQYVESVMPPPPAAAAATTSESTSRPAGRTHSNAPAASLPRSTSSSKNLP